MWDINFIFKINEENNDKLNIYKFSNSFFFKHLEFSEKFRNIKSFLLYLKNNTIKNNKGVNESSFEKYFKNEIDDLFYMFTNYKNYKKIKKKKEDEFLTTDKDSVLEFLNVNKLSLELGTEILNKFYWMKNNLDFNEIYIDQKIFLESLGQKINSLENKLYKEYLNEINSINKDVFFMFFIIKLKLCQIKIGNILFRNKKNKINQKYLNCLNFIEKFFKTEEKDINLIITSFIQKIQKNEINTEIDKESQNLKKYIEAKINGMTKLLEKELNEFYEYVKKEIKNIEIIDEIKDKDETKLNEDIYKWFGNKFHWGSYIGVGAVEFILYTFFAATSWPFLVVYGLIHGVIFSITLYRDKTYKKQYYIENLNEFKDDLEKDLSDYKNVIINKFKKSYEKTKKEIDSLEKGINEKLKVSNETFENVFNQYQNLLKEFKENK